MPASVAHLITPEKVFRLALKGHSQAGIAASIGVSRAALQIHLKERSDVRQAYEKGIAQDINEVVTSLKTMATEKNNAVAAIFYLKNRDPEHWKDKHDIQHSGNLTVNVGAFQEGANVFEGEATEIEEERDTFKRLDSDLGETPESES